MRFLLLINGLPESRAAAAALRFAGALVSSRHAILAVFFNQDGVRHAEPVTEVDAGGEIPHQCWLRLASGGEFPLLVCRAAWVRRASTPLPCGWRASGLAEFADLSEQADRLVTFGAGAG